MLSVPFHFENKPVARRLRNLRRPRSRHHARSHPRCHRSGREHHRTRRPVQRSACRWTRNPARQRTRAQARNDPRARAQTRRRNSRAFAIRRPGRLFLSQSDSAHGPRQVLPCRAPGRNRRHAHYRSPDRRSGPNICARRARTIWLRFSWPRLLRPISASSRSPRSLPALSTPSRAPASPAQRQQMTGRRQDLVKRIRRFSKLPVAVGFGISTPEQFAAVGKFAEGGRRRQRHRSRHRTKSRTGSRSLWQNS